MITIGSPEQQAQEWRNKWGKDSEEIRIYSPNMPLWHKDCLELKATEKKQTKDELSAAPHLPEKR